MASVVKGEKRAPIKDTEETPQYLDDDARKLIKLYHGGNKELKVKGLNGKSGGIKSFNRDMKDVDIAIHYGCLPKTEMYKAFYVGKASLRPSKKESSEVYTKCGSLSLAIHKANKSGLNFLIHMIFFPSFSEADLLIHASNIGYGVNGNNGGQSSLNDFLYIISFGGKDEQPLELSSLGNPQPARVYIKVHSIHVDALLQRPGSRVDSIDGVIIDAITDGDSCLSDRLLRRNKEVKEKHIKAVQLRIKNAENDEAELLQIIEECLLKDIKECTID